MIFYDREGKEHMKAASRRYAETISNTGGLFLEIKLNWQHEVTITKNHILVARRPLFGSPLIFRFPASSLERVTVEKKRSDLHLRMEFSTPDELYVGAQIMDIGKCNRHKLHDLVRNVQMLMDKNVIGVCVIEGESYLSD